MRRTLPVVVVIVALVAAALWYYMPGGDRSDAPPQDSARRGAEPQPIDRPDSEAPLAGREDETSPGATTTDSASSPAASDDGERGGTGTTTSTRASDDSLAEPAADSVVSAAPAAQDDGSAGTAQPIVENRTGTTPTPAPTRQGDPSIAQSPEVPLAVSDGVDGVDTSVSGPAESERASSAATPPVLESKPAGTLATVTGQTETEEPAHVETLARSGPLPTPANRADQSVTQEQVISVVPDDTVGRVTIREPAGDDAIGSELPVTGPGPAESERASSAATPPGLESKPAGTLATVTGQTETEEPAHVETLARSDPLPTPANRADQSVTQEQVISVVPDDTAERVTIREPGGDDAIGSELPVTGPGPAESERASSAATPPGLESKPAGTLAPVTGETETEEPAHVETLARSGPLPTPANRADQSVTQEQVISVVPDDTVERVTIREPAGDDAIGSELPVTGPGPAESERASSAATPPGLESKPAGTLATVTGQTETEEPAHVETLARPGPLPTPANRADQSVTQEQVISVVPDDTVERVTIREPAGDDAIGSELPVTGPVTGPAGVGRKPAGTLATGTEPTGTGEPANVETLARSGPLPTPANRADQSVTQEQVISVVPDDTVERVTIREPGGDDAIGSELPVTGPGPVTGPAGVGQKPAGTLATVTGQTETEEPAHVETLARSGPLPTPANRADQSVTQEQVISVVPDDTVERVTIRAPGGDDAIGSELPVTGPGPVTGPAGVGQKLAGTLATVTGQTETEEPAHVETLARSGPLPTPANRADQSVTQEQVISVVPDDTVERVTIREPGGDDASGSELPVTGPGPVTGPAGVGRKPTGTLATVTGQTETEEPAHVETLARSGPLPTPANRADQSVTQEQVISVVPDDTVERVTIREPGGDDASGSELPVTVTVTGPGPVTGPAGVGRKPAGTLATVTGQTETEEPAHVETLARSGPLPTPANRADQSVTQEQVISVVPDDTVERVTIREPGGDDASGSELPVTRPGPVTGPAGVGRKPAGTLPTGTEPTETEEPAHVETLARSGPLPTPANRADQSVTQEQVISVVPDDTVERVTIREPGDDDASGSELPVTRPGPVTGPAGVGRKPAGTLATVTGQTETEEPAHVETLARSGPLPTPANRADQSVTQERVISVVPDDTIERVTIRAPDGDDTVGGGTSVTGPAAVPEKLATTLAAIAADIGTEVKRIVETLTGTTAQPDPADHSDRSGSGEPSAKPNPTDATDLPDPQAKVTPPVPDETTERDGSPGPASDIEIEAQKFVETLTEPTPQPIPADRADHFVTQEQVISLVPDDIIERVTVRELVEDDTVSGDTPITVVRETEQIETITQERLIVESGGDVDKPVRIPLPSGNRIEQTTMGDIVADRSDQPARLVQVVRTVRHFEVTTLNDLLHEETNLDSLLSIIKQPYRIEVATLAELLQKQMAENPDSIFYLHTVLPTDEQGIWGIIHYGLIDKFARGVAIRRDENVETYTVRIPRYADERLDDDSSSFLGKLIDDKTKESFVYNFREHRMGRNPDRIYPSQELVIINFKTQELVAIYTHFAGA